MYGTDIAHLLSAEPNATDPILHLDYPLVLELLLAVLLDELVDIDHYRRQSFLQLLGVSFHSLLPCHLVDEKNRLTSR
jgi:hypothetical protein